MNARTTSPILSFALSGSLCVGGLILGPVTALADDSDLCISAAQDAADLSGVPLSVLLAIALTESGRTRNGETRPWPWTVNVSGEGYWFEDRAAAEHFASETRDRGIQSFDVGCFQVNHRWHGDQFISIEQMFDPLANASYAAKFLDELHDTTGDWSAAAGAYHSRNEEFASRYRSRFDAFRTEVIQAGLDLTSADGTAGLPALRGTAALPRRNDFPLLQQGTGVRTPGSLVILTNGG